MARFLSTGADPMSASLAGKKIVVIGLGLIGGSLARALRTAEPAARIHAMDRSAPALEQARADGTLDEWSHDPNSACRDADLSCWPFQC